VFGQFWTGGVAPAADCDDTDDNVFLDEGPAGRFSMSKVISVGGVGKLATAGVLVVAGAAVNRLFRPFDASVSRPPRADEPLVLTFPISPRQPLDDRLSEPAAAAAPAAGPIGADRPARTARPGSAVLTRRDASRKAWRCV
jgi:hypothetical protein